MSVEPLGEPRPHSQPHPHPHAEPHAAPPPHVQMLQIMQGMWLTQIASAVAQLGVADRIAAGVSNAGDLARDCGADAGALTRLLRAAETIGIVREIAPHHFALTPVGETLRSDTPHSLRDIVLAESAPGHWLPWGHLVEAIRTGRPTAPTVLGMDPWIYYDKNPDEARSFARGMSNLSAIASEEVCRVYDPGAATKIVDVGGSEGVLLRGLLRRCDAAGVLFDRPEVIEGAKEAIAQSGLADRIELVAGDFFGDIPTGADLYLLKWVLHDWPDDKCEEIVRNVHRAAPPDSRLLVIEMILPDAPGPSPVTLMDINMLVMLGGRERRTGDFGALLGRCGYAIERIVPAGMWSVIEARRM